MLEHVIEVNKAIIFYCVTIRANDMKEEIDEYHV